VLPSVRALGPRLADSAQFTRLVCAVTAIALCTRLLVLVAFWPAWLWQSGQIQDDWNKLAINWIDFGTFGFTSGVPSTQRGPVFPVLLTPLYLLFGEHYVGWSIALLLFDTGTVLLLMLLGRRMWGQRAALLAGFFYAIYLPVAYYTANIEQFTTVLPFVFLWFYLVSAGDQRAVGTRHYVVLGLVAGILMLSKSVYLPVVIGSAAALLWVQRKRHLRVALGHVTVLLVVAGLLIAPWSYRNYLVSGGRFILVQAYFWEPFWQKFVISDLDAREGRLRPAGRTLQYLLARQKELIEGLGDGNVERLSGSPQELYRENAFKGQVLDWIRRNPASYVRNVRSNIWYFWVGAENLQKTLLMAGMQLPLLGAATMGLWFAFRYRRIRTLRFGVALVVILWAEHAIIFAWGRFSLDTVPVLAVVFGVGLDAWFSRWERAPSGRGRGVEGSTIQR
jgi:4-amino-4-deoxy-L-arabinose transferase-like glycosyltransferase